MGFAAENYEKMKAAVEAREENRAMYGALTVYERVD